MTTTPEPYRAFPNSFKRRLLAGETLIGCWCSLANPITTEVLGIAGFDWLLLDGEHSPNDVTTFIPQLMALKDSASAPVVRPSWNDRSRSSACSTPASTTSSCPSCRAPTRRAAPSRRRAIRRPGMRGVSVSQRSNRFGTVADYLAGINDADQRDGADREPRRHGGGGARSPRSTASTASSSARPTSPLRLGHLGEPNHPATQAAIAQVFDAAKSAGKPTGILTPVEADARRYLAMGATFVAVGSDLGVFRSATQQLRDRFARTG